MLLNCCYVIMSKLKYFIQKMITSIIHIIMLYIMRLYKLIQPICFALLKSIKKMCKETKRHEAAEVIKGNLITIISNHNFSLHLKTAFILLITISCSVLRNCLRTSYSVFITVVLATQAKADVLNVCFFPQMCYY